MAFLKNGFFILKFSYPYEFLKGLPGILTAPAKNLPDLLGERALVLGDEY